MKSQNRTRAVIKTNQQSRALPITIFPRQITFEDVQSHSCYQIILYVRNEGKEIEKLRIIQPLSKMFKIKMDQNFTKTLAPGLTIKLNVYFMSEKLGDESYFQDKLFICGDSFKQTVNLIAFPPREQLVIPNGWNLGRLIVNRDNTALIPIKNQGKRSGRAQCNLNFNSVAFLVTKQLNIEPGQTKYIELRIKNKKIGDFQQILQFLNGKKCTLKGIFVEQSIDILNNQGQKLNLIDLGQIFIGQNAEQSFYVLNNTSNSIDAIFKSFNKSIEINDLKMDSERGNFIIKSLPGEYAKQLKSCYTSSKHDKCRIKGFQQFQNKLVVTRFPDLKQQRLFQAYANGQVVHELMQQPIIEALVIKVSTNKDYIKVPIKFISVFPRIKISESVVQFGYIKERMDYTRQISIQNQGERQINLIFENNESLRIEGHPILKPHSSQQLKLILRAVKAGNIQETAQIKLFEGLSLQLKIFACCRSSSIRAKKITHMNSARQLRKYVPLYQSLASPINFQKTNLTNMSDFLNKTDVLAGLRTARINKLLKQHIENEKQPILKQPQLSIKFQRLDTQVKTNPFMRRLKRDISCPKLTLKQSLKYAIPLKADQLQKIIIKENEISFGNIFINTNQIKEVKIINNNSEPILFQWDLRNYQCLKKNHCQITKIDGFSQKTFKICFRPDNLGAISLPLEYIINRNHIFQITLTAYVTLINLQISSKNLEYSFASLQNVFEKCQELQLANKSQESIECRLKFQQNKHFYVENEILVFFPMSQQKIKVFYKPVEGEQLGIERSDNDKLTVKVVGGAQNTIKCTGIVNDAKVTLKQNQIISPNHLVSTPLIGKLNMRNHSKIQTIAKIQVGNQLKDLITFDKQLILLNGQQKKQINYTIICRETKKVNSFIFIQVRGIKVIKVPVDIYFAFPQIIANRDVIDFGNIPIMGNNYQQTLTLVNMFKTQIKLQFSKKFENEDYNIEIREICKTKTQPSLKDLDFRPKKKQSNMRQQTKRGQSNQKIFKLLPSVQVSLQLKFIPKKFKQFDIQIPLKLSGTNNFIVQPVRVRLVCCGIEPVVYLQPHHIAFDTRIIGEGKSSFMRSFQIRNPHQFDIDWYIEPQQPQKNQCFYLSEQKGKLSAKQSVNIEVMFKPQQQGHFYERLDVILRQKKTSHISLQLQGNALLPSIKFNCNELLMPVVPLGVESRAFIILQNHGYDAITISRWKTSSHFQSVDISVNFIQGKLLSLAKKHLKAQVIIQVNTPISFTTFLEFFDEFGNKYEVPLSCTADNSIMTTYPYIEMQKSAIILQKKNNSVIITNKKNSNYDEDGGVSASQLASCQFIKNWLNYQINLSLKRFPACIVDSQGELFYRMINRISNLELIKRFQSNSNQTYYNNIYAYYSQSIKTLKIQGALLNQIRPQFFMSYKDYKAYLYSKKSIVQQEDSFNLLSIDSWIALFYQLTKLYVQPLLNQKIINKFSINNYTQVTSPFYSNYQLMIFKFLNAFNNDQPFYDFGNQIKFFEIFQNSFEKSLNINFTKSLLSLKISSVVMTPSIYMVLISKFLNQKLKQYGLCQFLSETDLFSLGAKQLMLTMISYISMLYHYSSSINVCFEASIGDKITKIIQIQNPINRRSKYRVKLLGSQQFQLQNEEISIAGKGKAQVRVSYHCKQNKHEEAKLLLVPMKEDNFSSAAQPMSFKLMTSILSKITLKKLQITAHLYEVTTISLQVQLPIDIIDICQFNVSLNEAQEGVNSFYCFNQMARILKNNHDKLEIKLVPLTLQSKFCRVCYRSSTYGQFNFEITAKVQTSPSIKELRLKQLKVNKDQIVSVYLPKQNQQLNEALRFLNDHHIKLDCISTTKKTISLNKYSISIVQSSYISILDQSTQIVRNNLEGKDNIRVDLKCAFVKPFNQYTCTMMVRNDALKDIRFYKIMTSVAMKPKIVPLSVRIRAQQSTTVKIPIKIAPCECIIEGLIQQFTFSNFSTHIKQNIEFIGTFSPNWILQKQVNIIAENRDTLEQVIYCVSLKADEPAFFDNIKLQGSTVFPKKVKIPINLSYFEDLKILSNSKRIVLDDAKITAKNKWINCVILPSSQEDMSNIKLIKQKNGHYYWASIFIRNKKLFETISITIEQKSNSTIKHVLEVIPLSPDYQIDFKADSYLNYEIINKGGNKYMQLTYSPCKEMEVNHKLHLMSHGNEYAIQIRCKCPALPIVIYPEISSYNLALKSSSLILLNPSDNRGVYRATMQPSDIFSLDSWQFQLKQHEKKQIKIYFTPVCLQTRYKAILRFECQSLPTYEYHLNGISEFDSCQKTMECEIYSDRQILTDLLFTNHFAKSEDFVIDTRFQHAPFQLVEPTHGRFRLEAGAMKKMLVKSKKCQNLQMQEGLLEVRLSERKWKYRLVPILIKNFTTKKYSWHCKARDTLYESIQLPDKIIIKSLQSPPELSPYLTFSIQQGTNTLKLKYSPLKPVPKQQYQIFLLADKSKYVINCVVSVSEPQFDDTILIKTKEINQCGCVVFKLTNIKKVSAPFKAYFMKGEPDLFVQTDRNILQGYGRPGTVIKIKFISNVYNKRVEDELYIQTSETLWRFKVKGILSKKIQLK